MLINLKTQRDSIYMFAFTRIVMKNSLQFNYTSGRPYFDAPQPQKNFIHTQSWIVLDISDVT